MNNISDQDLLQVWEQGIHQPLIEKSLLLLARFYKGTSFDQWAHFSIGTRDIALMLIRKEMFGMHLQNVTDCPHCNSKIEWENSLDNWGINNQTLLQASQSASFQYGDLSFEMRLPNSGDILELLRQDPQVEGEAFIIRRCLPKDLPPPFSQEKLPEEFKKEISLQLESADPYALMNMGITCPECGKNSLINFDIMEYLWAEIHEWALRLLRNVGMLALHFGWSEESILKMGNYRRQLYLNML